MSTTENGFIRINDAEEIKISGSITARSFDLKLPNKTGITIYCFNSLMFPIKAERAGEETYSFQGPKLGHYHSTIDIREGPYVNHYIEKLEVAITYTPTEANIVVNGVADLSKSNYRPDLYKGPKQGNWFFHAKFTHIFHNVKSS